MDPQPIIELLDQQNQNKKLVLLLTQVPQLTLILNYFLSINDLLKIIFDKVVTELRELLSSLLLAIVILPVTSELSLLVLIAHLTHHLRI